MLNGLDLFSGIGGITVALAPWVRPVAYCEIDEYARAVLLSRMAEGRLPVAPIWDDVRTFPGRDFRGQIDIIYGGFPCQDLSSAGSRKGLEAERSGLFFEIMRLAEEIRPTFIFLENVPGIRKYLHLVAREMASLRYDCRWGMLSAHGLGAPHKRERWFCLAYAKRAQRRKGYSGGCRMEWDGGLQEREENAGRSGIGSETVADGAGLETRVNEQRSEAEYADAADACKDIMRQSWWSIEPDVGRVVDGLPFRVDRIKALGNAVVSAQVSEAFKRLTGI